MLVGASIDAWNSLLIIDISFREILDDFSSKKVCEINSARMCAIVRAKYIATEWINFLWKMIANNR